MLETKQLSFERKQDEILNAVQTINNNLSRYKGFVGGVAFVMSAVVTFITFAKEWVISHLK